MTIEKIRELKKKLGISNATLADQSGVPLGTVNKALSGASACPRYITLAAMWETLKRMEEEQNRSADYYSVDDLYRRAPMNSLLREEALAYGVSRHKGPGQFTIEDYYSLSDEHRLELIDGVFYDMAAPTTYHQSIMLSLTYQIESYIRKTGGACRAFFAPVDVMPDPGDQKTILQPDVMIVCDPEKIHEKRVEGAPDFICEVVSPSSLQKDYFKKGAKYQETGVKEYWIINPKNRMLTVYNYFENEPPRILPLEGKLGLRIYNDDLSIDLDDLAAVLPNTEKS